MKAIANHCSHEKSDAKLDEYIPGKNLINGMTTKTSYCTVIRRFQWRYIRQHSIAKMALSKEKMILVIRKTRNVKREKAETSIHHTTLTYLK